MSLFPKKDVLATRTSVKATNAGESEMPNTRRWRAAQSRVAPLYARREDHAGKICDGANSLSILACGIPADVLPFGIQRVPLVLRGRLIGWSLSHGYDPRH